MSRVAEPSASPPILSGGAGPANRIDWEQRQGRYQARFARSADDLDAVYALRFAVFNLEMGAGLRESWASGRDTDEFDAQFDHLLVSDLETGAVVGTYRLQTAAAAARGRGFYTATEFDLSRLPAGVRRDSVELGRACIAADHRHQRVLYLLWRGLGAYMQRHRTRYFFGCCTLTSQDPAEGWAAHAWLTERGYVEPEIEVEPRPRLRCPADPGSEPGRPVEIPRLFWTYLRHGARVCSPPALDRRFGTIVFLALLDVRNVPPKLLANFVS
ncbi:MAG: GNAT family N-acetyltransferase [Proteobacteria bacterium]|nr:GNAT family N-acetyltransferase [Pseudomonadota bacterium]